MATPSSPPSGRTLAGSPPGPRPGSAGDAHGEGCPRRPHCPHLRCEGTKGLFSFTECQAATITSKPWAAGQFLVLPEMPGRALRPHVRPLDIPRRPTPWSEDRRLFSLTGSKITRTGLKQISQNFLKVY